mmetsp:Transcript_6468/g.18652  ORF Transcript_6468/g.18652 Transcript_6468/m.18652 type:complete len:305 (-) Transcript_6468:334-1248(-)
MTSRVSQWVGGDGCGVHTMDWMNASRRIDRTTDCVGGVVCKHSMTDVGGWVWCMSAMQCTGRGKNVRTSVDVAPPSSSHVVGPLQLGALGSTVQHRLADTYVDEPFLIHSTAEGALLHAIRCQRLKRAQPVRHHIRPYWSARGATSRHGVEHGGDQCMVVQGDGRLEGRRYDRRHTCFRRDGMEVEAFVVAAQESRLQHQRRQTFPKQTRQIRQPEMLLVEALIECEVDACGPVEDGQQLTVGQWLLDVLDKGQRPLTQLPEEGVRLAQQPRLVRIQPDPRRHAVAVGHDVLGHLVDAPRVLCG